MDPNDFHKIISSIHSLSPVQIRQLRRELENRAAATRPAKPPPGPDAEESAFDVASRAGLIGCIKAAPHSPTDLSTNPKHMEGFGRE